MQEASLDRWTTLFLLAAAQGIFLSVMLFMHKKGNRRANNILGLFLLLFALMLVFYVSYWSGYSVKYQWLNFWTEPFTFLYGPLLYFYLNVLKYNRLPKRYIAHLIPGSIQALFLVPFLLRNAFGRIEWLRIHFFSHRNLIEDLLLIFTHMQNISLVCYGIAIFIMVRNDQQQLNKYAIKEELEKNKWLKKVAWLYAGFTISVLSYWMLAWSGLIRPDYDYLISFAMTAFIYTVGYLGFHQPAIFGIEITGNPGKPDAKYAKSTLRADLASTYLNKLIRMMQEERPYLDSNIKIQQMAERMGISSHHLSQLINESLNQNFADFINSYRIEEAKRLLLLPSYEQEKILSIAFDSGFQNKATFNATFKKHTGMSPTEFKKYQQKVLVN